MNVEIKYKDLALLRAEDPTANLDILWKTSLLFGNPRPSWNGMMQLVHHGRHQGKSSVMFLPMIDMNPSDVTCVSSTLHFVSEHAKQHSIANPIVTFDQPLWLKAFNIIQTEPPNSDLRKIVVCLGAFHAELSWKYWPSDGRFWFTRIVGIDICVQCRGPHNDRKSNFPSSACTPHCRR